MEKWEMGRNMNFFGYDVIMTLLRSHGAMTTEELLHIQDLAIECKIESEILTIVILSFTSFDATNVLSNFIRRICWLKTGLFPRYQDRAYNFEEHYFFSKTSKITASGSLVDDFLP